MFNGQVNRTNAYRLIQECNSRVKKKNAFLLLTTLGGDPNAAYIIARYFQSDYEKFTLFVPGLCKSAGTLIALGAHELIISSHGELGPLDVQLSKKDELGETQSGLVAFDSISQLQRFAFEAFEDFFLRIKRGSGFTSQTCTKIAIDLTNGLFTPIYGQIDPLHLGETGRAMNIAWNYGSRLVEEGKNITQDSVDKLVQYYPSHNFVIDRAEAGELFKEVKEPSALEQSLSDSLGLDAFLPTRSSDPFIEIFPHENETSQTIDSELRLSDPTKSTKRTNDGRQSVPKEKSN